MSDDQKKHCLTGVGRWAAGILAVCIVFMLAGCARDAKKNEETVAEMTEQPAMEIEESPQSIENETEPSFEPFRFVDAHGEEHETTINPNVAINPYEPSAFVHQGDLLTYEDDTYTSRLGIDVSRHQGKINWKKVKKSGITFAFIRIGFRGYGEEGRLVVDEQFQRNIQKAQAQGIDVGVYFFAQAINEKEAREEAAFVLKNLEGYQLQLPLVYDPESILDDDARTDDVTGEQFTKNTIAFCEEVSAAGYRPMIYCNMMWEAYMLDLEALSDLPVWYADYEKVPQSPYLFEYWQYTDKAQIGGIAGGVDLNVQLIKK